MRAVDCAEIHRTNILVETINNGLSLGLFGLTDGENFGLRVVRDHDQPEVRFSTQFAGRTFDCVVKDSGASELRVAATLPGPIMARNIWPDSAGRWVPGVPLAWGFSVIAEGWLMRRDPPELLVRDSAGHWRTISGHIAVQRAYLKSGGRFVRRRGFFLNLPPSKIELREVSRLISAPASEAASQP